MANIETNIKEYRENKKMTQKELAEKVGVRRETIVHLEKNKYNPSLELALEIAEIFEVAVEKMFKLKKD